MKAFLLAAGLGKRLRPLTRQIPKPLVPVGGKPLIQWHIEKLRQAGITELVINCHWLAGRLVSRLGDGSDLGVQIHWSREPDLLDVGGGVRAALPLLGAHPFLLVSADIWSDINYADLAAADLDDAAASLVMVPTPAFYPQGDFVIDDKGLLQMPEAGEPGLAYSGVGILHPGWVAEWQEHPKAFPFIQPLSEAVKQGRVRGSLHQGSWTDVGTLERLEELRREVESDWI